MVHLSRHDKWRDILVELKAWYYNTSVFSKVIYRFNKFHSKSIQFVWKLSGPRIANSFQMKNRLYISWSQDLSWSYNNQDMLYWHPCRQIDQWCEIKGLETKRDPHIYDELISTKQRVLLEFPTNVGAEQYTIHMQKKEGILIYISSYT